MDLLEKSANSADALQTLFFNEVVDTIALGDDYPDLKKLAVRLTNIVINNPKLLEPILEYSQKTADG